MADMAYLDKVSHMVNGIFMWVAGGLLGAMILLTCANIFLRLIWVPISGTYELMGYFGAVVMAFALGYTQIRRGHIAVDVLVLGFPKKAQNLLNSINCLICMIFFGLATWQICRYAGVLWKTGEVSETLRIIYYPFAYGVALGCAALSLVFLMDFLRSLVQKGDEN
jgi:TRAP-type C4-dicarboxylate transport system permease small subunit